MARDAQNEHYPASDGWAESFVRRIGPPFVGADLLAGDKLAAALLRLANRALSLEQPKLCAHLTAAARWAVEHNASKYPVGADPTKGFGQKHPFWSILLSDFGGPKPLDSIRLLFLHRMARDQNFGAYEIADEARTTILELDQFVPVAVTQHVDRLAAIAEDVIKGSATGSEARALIAHLENMQILRPEPAKALKKLFHFARQKPTLPARRTCFPNSRSRPPTSRWSSPLIGTRY